MICRNRHPMYRLRAHPTKTLPKGRFYYYCRECPKGNRPFVWCNEIDTAVHDAVMSMKDQDHIVSTVKPGDTYGDEISQVKEDIRDLDPEADDYDTQLAALRAELKRLRGLPRKPVEIITKPDGKKVGKVWESLDVADRRQWLLARRASRWLSDDEHIGARVQVFDRNPEGGWITDIDLGEWTEYASSTPATLRDRAVW